MRRLARQSFVKHVSAAVTGGAHSVAPGANYQHVLFSSEKQAGTALNGFQSRLFSQSRLAQSAAESAAQQAPPYLLYGAVGAAGLGVITYFMARQPADSTLAPAVVNSQTPPLPKDSVEIGKFHVQDHMGMHFTQDELLGNFAVLYFGKIGDDGRRARLLQMAEAVMESDRKSNMHYLTPVFASLDPKEDDVIKMNAMVEDYATALNRKSILHVRLKAITGDDNFKLHERAQAFTSQVKGKRGVSTNPSTATKDDTGDLYFVNPEGEFIASYGPDASPKDIALEWSEVMKARRSHPLKTLPKPSATRPQPR